MTATKRILVLITERVGPNDKNWDFFRNALLNVLPDNVEVTMGELTQLTFELDETGDRIYDRKRGFSLDDFDLVVFRFIRREFARAASCASFLKARNIPYIDSQIQPGYWSKYSAVVQRYHAGMLPISSVFTTSQELLYMIQHDRMPFPYPLVIKDVNGKKGRLNFIAHTKSKAVEVLSEHINGDNSFIVQKFIENDGDYRLLVIGGVIKIAIHRRAVKDSHLNNTSQGATATIVDIGSLSKGACDDAIQAAALENLEVAGVDIIIDKQTGQHYVLEVNSSPQLATGIRPDLKMSVYGEYLYELLTVTKQGKKIDF